MKKICTSNLSLVVPIFHPPALYYSAIFALYFVKTTEAETLYNSPECIILFCSRDIPVDHPKRALRRCGCNLPTVHEILWSGTLKSQREVGSCYRCNCAAIAATPSYFISMTPSWALIRAHEGWRSCKSTPTHLQRSGDPNGQASLITCYLGKENC